MVQSAADWVRLEEGIKDYRKRFISSYSMKYHESNSLKCLSGGTMSGHIGKSASNEVISVAFCGPASLAFATKIKDPSVIAIK